MIDSPGCFRACSRELPPHGRRGTPLQVLFTVDKARSATSVKRLRPACSGKGILLLYARSSLPGRKKYINLVRCGESTLGPLAAVPDHGRQLIPEVPMCLVDTCTRPVPWEAVHNRDYKTGILPCTTHTQARHYELHCACCLSRLTLSVVCFLRCRLYHVRPLHTESLQFPFPDLHSRSLDDFCSMLYNACNQRCFDRQTNAPKSECLRVL
jgi:hypothetical protein